jgi:transposase
MRPKGTPFQLQERRLAAVVLLSQGMAVVEVAKRIGVERRSVRRWKANLNAKGMVALLAKKAKGRPPKLDTEAKERLRTLLSSGHPELLGPFFTSGPKWRRYQILKYINATFGIKYTSYHVSRIIKSMNMNLIQMNKLLKERSEPQK